METPETATILIVDDEERNRKLFEVFVKADGYRAVSAPGGQEGMRLAKHIHPDLILLDLMMPEMDGFEVARWLKNDPLTQDIPVVVLSSLCDTAARGRLQASGAEEFIAKPVDRWKLSRTISRVLAGDRIAGSSEDESLA